MKNKLILKKPGLKFVIILILFNSLFCLGQTTPKKPKGLGKCLSAKIESTGEHVAHGAVIGAVSGLKDAHFQQVLDSIVNSLLSQITKSITAEVVTLRDTITDPKTIKQLDSLLSGLRNSVLGYGLRKNVKQLLDTILNKNLFLKEKIAVRTALDEALSSKTKKELSGILDTLGIIAGQKISPIIDTLMAKLNKEIKLLTGQFKTGEAEVETKLKEATTRLYILLGIIVLILLLLIYIYRMKIKMEKLSGILSFQVHQTKDENVFKDLKQRISNHAKQEGLEPMLRNLLKSKGILGDSTRQSVTETTNKNK